ncbi:unnamed protein product [Mortierella alpina]
MPSAINMQVGIPRRHLILLLCGLGLMISYADRSNMAVAIVAIASEFHYSKSQQGIILASFFIGYILTPIVGGTLADRYGGKAVLAFGAAAWTVFTLLTPFASEMGLGWVVAVRIALGLGEGVAYPSVHAMIGTWIPPSERSKAVATVTAFSYLGGVIALPTSSALVVSPWGWRSVFWLFGTLGLLWSIAWQIWGASNPLSCRGISESELHWLLEQQKLDRQVNNTQSDPQWDSEERLNEQEPSRIISTNGARITYRPISTSAVELAESRSSEDSTDGVTTNPFGASANQTQHPSTSRSAMAMRWQKFRSEVLSGTSVRRGEDEVAVAVPWKDLLARREVWAVIISQFCNSIGFFVMQSWIPTFYLDFYGVDVGKIGYYAGTIPAIESPTDAALVPPSVRKLIAFGTCTHDSFTVCPAGVHGLYSRIFGRQGHSGLELVTIDSSTGGSNHWKCRARSLFITGSQLCPHSDSSHGADRYRHGTQWLYYDRCVCISARLLSSACGVHLRPWQHRRLSPCAHRGIRSGIATGQRFGRSLGPHLDHSVPLLLSRIGGVCAPVNESKIPAVDRIR